LPGPCPAGPHLKEEIIRLLPNVDLFLSEAGAEVVRMYDDLAKLKEGMRVYRDNTASAVPVTFLYEGSYHGCDRASQLQYHCEVRSGDLGHVGNQHLRPAASA
jgi:hypothetical protein